MERQSSLEEGSSSKSIESRSSPGEDSQSDLIESQISPKEASLKFGNSQISSKEESLFSSKSLGSQVSFTTSQDRLEDLFQDEIIKEFAEMTDFKSFVRSKRGLCLDDHVIQHIIENNSDSVVDQKMALLNKWREIEGDEATVHRIRDIVSGCKISNPRDYISVCNSMFGIFLKKKLSKRGHVFLGEQFSDLVGQRLRAIKFAPYSDENMREAQILTKLEPHENIVSTIHVDSYYGSPIKHVLIVMELCSTKHLREVFEECKVKPILDEHMAIDWVLQIIKPLVFIHQHNVLQRDLKPENVLISDDYKHLKLTDFGISKAITNGLQTQQTQALGLRVTALKKRMI